MNILRSSPPPAVFRLLVGVLLGLLVGALAPAQWPVVARMLTGWCALCLVVLSDLWPVLLNADPQRTRTIATREDDTRTLAWLMSVAAALVSLPGVGWTLALSHRRTDWQLDLIALAALTTALSWLLLHTEHTLHYARRYYQDGGGVLFQEGDGTLKDPAYRDFLYLSFTIGMTYQVSDTNINSREMRWLLLQHAMLSYLFGTVAVALTVGGVASLLG